MSKQLFLIICFLFVLLATSPEVFAQAVPPSGMVGWWAGDGDARDISGNGFHGGLFNGGAYAINKVGQGFDFVPGSVTVPSHLQVPDNAALRPAQFTVEVWIKFTPEFSNFHVAIAKGFASGFNDSYAVGTNGIANPQFFTTHNGSTHVLAAPTNLANPNSWNHLAASYDGSTKRLYVNGVLVNSIFVGQPIDYDVNPAPLTIGADWENGVPRYHFNGFVDEPTLYNRALSDAEVAAIFNAGVSGKIKSATSAAGANSQTVVNDATITFQNVTATGTTSDFSIDPASAGTLPAGYTQTNLAYDISTAAAHNGTINLCFHIPSINDVTVFNKLKVLHSEGGVLADKTTLTNFPTRFVCGTVTSLSPFVIANGLSPTATNGTVGGRILDADGNPVAGVAVRMNGTRSRLTITDAQGSYQFDNVETNDFYTVTPARANYSFSPAQRSFSQLGHHTDAAFTASPSGTTVNSLTATEYFVRQQYIDFLNREPDEAGLNFWVNNIETCGNDAGCREAKRIDTSAAFFLSIEFQQTGYLVYKTYRAAYGTMPNAPVPLRLSEFRPDTQAIGNGVVVTQTGWERALENNKQAFLTAFVQRSRFMSAFPSSMTASQFVDTLNANAADPLSQSERERLVNQLAVGAMTRDEVLRAIADDSDLNAAEFNRAFVLMQYFGYLRRNPNDPQDSDYSGFDFWLTKLNQFHGHFREAEMVKAFITSGEYRQRFGP